MPAQFPGLNCLAGKRGAPSRTHRSPRFGRIESWYPWVSSLGNRSLAGVAVGFWVVSESTLGGNVAGFPITTALPFNMAQPLQQSRHSRRDYNSSRDYPTRQAQSARPQSLVRSSCPSLRHMHITCPHSLLSLPHSLTLLTAVLPATVLKFPRTLLKGSNQHLFHRRSISKLLKPSDTIILYFSFFFVF